MRNFCAGITILTLSIVSTTVPVKARAESNSSHKQTAEAAFFDPGNLIHYTGDHGEEETLGINTSKGIGLDGIHVIKSIKVHEVVSGKDRHTLHSFVVYDSTYSYNGEALKPQYLFFLTRSFVGANTESDYFMMDLLGGLERVTTLKGKVDEAGKPIHSAATVKNEDINSREIQKTFKGHIKTVKKWLDEQMRKEKAKPAAEPAKQ